MLHELFFILLGFHSDLIDHSLHSLLKGNKDDDRNYTIEKPNYYKLKVDIDLFKESEREQINSLLPLGWYHIFFNNIISSFDMSWENILSFNHHHHSHDHQNHKKDQVSSIKIYFCAMVQGNIDMYITSACITYVTNISITVNNTFMIIINYNNTSLLFITMIIGISDIQQEYIEDIAYLEQLLINTGPMPLSNILQHLQKVYHVDKKI